jgi:prolipoprotein diacylglyceryltransferase
MFNQFTNLFGQEYQTYTIALAASILLSILWLALLAPKGQVAASFDTCFAGLIGGIVLGRLFHLALNWIYFSENLNLIHRIDEQGGLNWHGALLGAFLAGALIARLRGLKLPDLLRNLSPVVPLIAFAGWYGAASAGVAYGKTVEHMADYPAFFTWIERDIYGLVSPRFAVQQLGMAWTGFIFLLALIIQWRKWLENRRLPLVILLLCLGAFGLAFLRGDYALIFAGLRAEQWLDIVFGGIALVWLIRGI